MIEPKGWKFTLNKRIFILLFLMVVWGIWSCEKIENNLDATIKEEKVLDRYADFDFPWKTNYPLDNNNLEQKLILQNLINKWYEEDFKHLDEPNLSQLKDSSYVIRISNWGSWGEYRVQRLEKINGMWIIHFKINFINEEGEFTFNNVVNLSDQTKLNNFEKKINEFNSSNRTTFNKSGLDGQTYILEVYKNGHYYFIERWSPREEYEKEFLKLIELMNQLYFPKL